MFRRFLYDKRIREKNYPRCHWTRKRGRWKPKFPYNSQTAAEEFIRERHLTDYEAYRCPVCHKWHIGYHKRKE